MYVLEIIIREELPPPGHLIVADVLIGSTHQSTKLMHLPKGLPIMSDQVCYQVSVVRAVDGHLALRCLLRGTNDLLTGTKELKRGA